MQSHFNMFTWKHTLGLNNSLEFVQLGLKERQKERKKERKERMGKIQAHWILIRSWCQPGLALPLSPEDVSEGLAHNKGTADPPPPDSLALYIKKLLIKDKDGAAGCISIIRSASFAHKLRLISKPYLFSPPFSLPPAPAWPGLGPLSDPSCSDCCGHHWRHFRDTKSCGPRWGKTWKWS